MPRQPGSPRALLSRFRLSLRAQGVAVLAVPLAALFAALFSIYWVEGDVNKADQTVTSAYATRGALVDLRNSLLDAQSAMSGYLATGQDRYLQLYASARRSVAQTEPRAAALVQNENASSAPFSVIRRLTSEELSILETLRGQGPGHSESASVRERERVL